MIRRLSIALLACALVAVAVPIANAPLDTESGAAFMFAGAAPFALPADGMWQTGWLDWLRFGAAVVVAFITAWCSRDPAPGGC